MRIRTRSTEIILLAALAISTPFATAQFPIPKIKIPKTPTPVTTPAPTSQSSAVTSGGVTPPGSAVNNQAPSSGPLIPPTSVNMPSIQITLRTQRDYYRNGQRDQETWSWVPKIVYRVNGPITAGGQLLVDFTLPSGKPWVKLNCNTKETKEGYWWETECGANTSEIKDEEATIETGIAGFKIDLKNELEGTNKTLFSGKFKVGKFHVGVVDLPKFKNNFSYYVDYDWNLPIGYIYDYDNMDHRAGYPPSKTEGRLTFVTWFKGTPDLMNFGKHVAYLYYQGKQVADSTGGDKFGAEGCQVEDAPSEDSPYTYCRHYFTVNATVWDKQAEYHPMDFPMYKNPGEYEIKVLENGKLVRTAKFTMGLGGKLIDTGIGTQSGLGTGRIVIPVQVLGDQDGQWDKNAWKTEAFYQHPLTGFTAP